MAFVAEDGSELRAVSFRLNQQADCASLTIPLAGVSTQAGAAYSLVLRGRDGGDGLVFDAENWYNASDSKPILYPLLTGLVFRASAAATAGAAPSLAVLEGVEVARSAVLRFSSSIQVSRYRRFHNVGCPSLAVPVSFKRALGTL